MTTNVKTLLTVSTLKQINEILKFGHHAFPILNKYGNVCGVIPGNFIIKLLKK
jgi:hypothetical protein